MSMSLRDQLLAAGLVSQKQVRDAERQQQHEQRGQNQQRAQQLKRGQQAPRHKQSAPAGQGPRSNEAVQRNPPDSATVTRESGATGSAAVGALPSAVARQASAQSAKVARDLALNKKLREKAEKKARAAQIRQLIEQNRVPREPTDERYNFVDGGRVRCVSANAEIRRRLLTGELQIVRHGVGHEVVPAAIAQRIRERDEHAVVHVASTDDVVEADTSVDDAYKDFAVPDDLMW